MPAIQAANNGSGLDVPELVDKLVAAEGAPATARLDRKEAEVQEGLTAMGAFRGAVSGFQATLGGLADPDVFAQMRVDSDDEDALTATANAQASPGRYEVEIVQLAQAQRLASDTLESDVNPLGTGTLTLQIGRFDAETGRFRLNPDTRPHTITIDAASGSLRGIAEAINRANAGVRAAVVNDGSGYRLLLSSAVAGNDGQIRLQ
ncbi:MAG TPA: flagellar hook protein, partial [Gammaproteobacteria bacterium]|nr:flagellar hook protein [Gammaproteobacteria bacterium]